MKKWVFIMAIDGHILNFNTVLSNLKHKSGPQLLHIITKKGKGYKIAEMDPVKYHGVTPFNIKLELVTQNLAMQFIH